MTYKLIIGDRTYSSWSLRGWLLFEKFGLKAAIENVDFSTRDVALQLSGYPPARTVPTVICEDGAVLSDSLAIAEELASRHPDSGLWPEDPLARATARNLACEMHSAFSALRTDCPMHLGAAYRDVDASQDVSEDLRRIEQIWRHARQTTKPDGPWLTGDYSAADAFFAPVAARIAGYGLEVAQDAQDYVEAHLADLAFRRWRAIGLAGGGVLEWYNRDHATTIWPGPAAIPATDVSEGPAINETCPYSGKPVTDFAKIGEHVYGFCNALCRDKTVIDAEAFPDFMKIYRS